MLLSFPAAKIWLQYSGQICFFNAILWKIFFKTYVSGLSSAFPKQYVFVAREIQYFELLIFSFNSYVCYLTRGFIASTRAFNLLTRAFNLATRAFSLVTRGFELVTREFELVTRGFELVTCGFELATRGFELTTRGFELVTRNSCFTFPPFDRGVTFHRIILWII